MPNVIHHAVICLAVFTAVSCAQPPNPVAAEPLPNHTVESGAPLASPDGSPLSADSTTEQVLDALDHRGKGLLDFTADVSLAERDPDLGDATTRKGIAVYQKKGEGDARIRVTFKSKQEGKKLFEQKTEYLLDDGWLTDRDFARKTEVRRQVLRPGEKFDLFKLGEGPFPLPVGQSRADVEKLFQATRSAIKPADPDGTVHITLTPRPETQFARKFASIDVWVDTRTAMPRRIVTLDPGKSVERQTDLQITHLNSGIKDVDFVLDPLPADWNRHEEKFSD